MHRRYGRLLFWILAAIIHTITWFSCGTGQAVVLALMIINTEANSDAGLTAIYMFASSVYHTIIFIWFYHKSQQGENDEKKRSDTYL